MSPLVVAAFVSTVLALLLAVSVLVRLRRPLRRSSFVPVGEGAAPEAASSSVGL